MLLDLQFATLVKVTLELAKSSEKNENLQAACPNLHSFRDWFIMFLAR